MVGWLQFPAHPQGGEGPPGVPRPAQEPPRAAWRAWREPGPRPSEQEQRCCGGYSQGHRDPQGSAGVPLAGPGFSQGILEGLERIWNTVEQAGAEVLRWQAS